MNFINSWLYFSLLSIGKNDAIEYSVAFKIRGKTWLNYNEFTNKHVVIYVSSTFLPEPDRFCTGF